MWGCPAGMGEALRPRVEERRHRERDLCCGLLTTSPPERQPLAAYGDATSRTGPATARTPLSTTTSHGPAVRSVGFHLPDDTSWLLGLERGTERGRSSSIYRLPHKGFVTYG